MSARKSHVAFGDEGALVEIVRVLGQTGALSFELAWTHPEYPVGLEEAPPAGVPVTWTVAARYRIKARGRRAVDVLRMASAHGSEHPRVVTRACIELVRSMGATVTTIGDEHAFDGVEVVETPLEARRTLESLS